MNCLNCGANMRWQEGLRTCDCGYRESMYATSDPQDIQGLRHTGPQSDLMCPVGCGTLGGAVLDGEPVAACEVCNGILVPSATFGRIVEVRRRTWRGPEDPITPFDATDLDRAINCPGCTVLMETHSFYGPGNTVIDSCSDCNVVWLDGGELTALERAPGRR